MTRRLCVFCDARSELTREHIWPRWFDRLIADENLGDFVASGVGRERTVRSIDVRAGQVLLLHGVGTSRGDIFRGAIGSLRSLPWRATH